SAALAGMHTSAKQAADALSAAGLAHQNHIPSRLLSQGQRRRLALARLAISHESRLWVLDEPFNALDTHATQWLSGLVRAHAQAGGITVLTSHHEVPLDASISQIQVTL